MMANLSVLFRFRQGTRILLAVFAALVIGVVFVGLNDVQGYILGYLATAVLFFTVTRTWRTMRRFAVLFAASLFGIFFLSFLYAEVMTRIAVMIGGIGALQGTAMTLVQVILTYIILFFGPVGLFFGIVGTVVLGISRLISLKSRKNIAGST